MSADPSLPPEPLPLTEASVQEIQLELIRRRRFNLFAGDLPLNNWNVDDLYILTDTLEQAHALQRIAEAEQWEPDNVTVLSEQGERSRALGTSDPGYVIAFWWA